MTSPVDSAESRLRDALMAAILPSPGTGRPGIAQLDLRTFWPRFSAAAPFHLRLGFRVAVWVIGAFLPRLCGSLRGIAGLDEKRRDLMVQRAARWPLFRQLFEVAKVVAMFAYFDDPEVNAFTRGRR